MLKIKYLFNVILLVSKVVSLGKVKYLTIYFNMH